MSASLTYASQLHTYNPTWECFFREVFGLAGAIATEFPEHESRCEFETTDEYSETVKMFSDILENGPKSPKRETKEIVIRLPISVHEWMVDRAKREGYATLTKYALHKLLAGCLEPNNGRNGTLGGLSIDEEVPMETPCGNQSI